MANLGVGLVSVYKSYVQSGGNTVAARRPNSRLIEFQNGMVGIQVKSLGGDFSQFESQLTNVGMQITAVERLLRAGRAATRRSTSCRRSRSCPRPRRGSPLY